LIGGSSLIGIAIAIVRTKAMAVLLGPAGFGLMSLYGSIADLAKSVATMGVNSSGVRQIAEAVGSGEKERIARTATVLRRISVVFGLLGAGMLVLFSSQISVLTFGDDQHGGAVALLSLAVFFGCVTGGQGALIQGMRRISDLAKMGVLGAMFGTIIGIPMVYYWGDQGVVPSLVAVAGTGTITSWWYSRKVRIQAPSMTTSDVLQEAAGLLKLGLSFMASGLMGLGVAYVVRIILLKQFGIEAAGFYQSSWTLGSLYIGIILQAMGADFLPRLTAVAENNSECNNLVNEQAQISLLVGGPGVIATLTFAPTVLWLFYSATFSDAVDLLRWICLGMTLRMITWPMSFIIVAKGEQGLFFWTDVAWTVVNIGLTWLCVRLFGVNGAGIAFFGSYVFHGLMIYPIVRRISGFRWSAANWQTGQLFIFVIASVFYGFSVLTSIFATGLGVLAVILTGVYSIRTILRLVSVDRIPRSIFQLLVWLRLVRLSTLNQSQ
jgi:enterobacterial common antigen flippase